MSQRPFGTLTRSYTVNRGHTRLFEMRERIGQTRTFIGLRERRWSRRADLAARRAPTR